MFVCFFLCLQNELFCLNNERLRTGTGTGTGLAGQEGVLAVDDRAARGRQEEGDDPVLPGRGAGALH